MDIFRHGKQASLGQLASHGTAPQKIAELAEAIWLSVDRELSPILGHIGVRALYKRSVSFIVAEHPWLQAAYEGALDKGPFASLRLALAHQSAFSAAAANGALLEVFCNLLTNLIGGPLTERLVQPALDPSTSETVEEI